jgi:GTP-binding protein Era
MNETSAKSKAGFVAVVGRPNVGKSSVINSLLGQKVSAVSPRPQTTRKRQLGILSIDDEDRTIQIIFIDTPGIHNPMHKLGEKMNQEARDILEDSDLIMLVVDGSQPPTDEDQLIFALLRKLHRNIPVILAVNKTDLISDEELTSKRDVYIQSVPGAVEVPISATRKINIQTLLDEIIRHLPVGYPFYPPDQITDLYEREIAADLIREAALKILREEVPHGVAVRIDQFTERGETGAYIEATLFVERESHKPIVVGKGGKMIKLIGSAARKEIEAMSGRKVYLRLNVKVRKDWRNDEKILRRFGY